MFLSVHPHLFNAFKISFYIALLVIAVYWGISSDWLDFYDASLWILCFFMVELNIFKYETEHDAHGQDTRTVQ